MAESVSKLLGHVVLQPPDESVSKLLGHVVLQPPDESVSKLVAYVVLTSVSAQMLPGGIY